LVEVNHEVGIDWNGPRQIEGIIYTVYRFTTDRKISPLYVGIARCAGKEGGLSVLFGHDMNRFHHGRKTNGHVDRISRTIKGEIDSYANWTAILFNAGATLNGVAPEVVLQSPTFVHIEIWSRVASSIILGNGPTAIGDEEMLRISVFRAAGFRHQLLNRHGNAD
jgi:hypothetical protein